MFESTVLLHVTKVGVRVVSNDFKRTVLKSLPAPVEARRGNLAQHNYCSHAPITRANMNLWIRFRVFFVGGK